VTERGRSGAVDNRAQPGCRAMNSAEFHPSVNRPSRAGPPAAGTGDVPGGVYLCQVSDTVACGACCGLYNVADASAGALAAMLTLRSERFAAVPRDPDAIADFGRRIAAVQAGGGPFPEFHHCPYIGFIGSGRSRVGCLLHPLADGNHGVDYRGLSYYGGMACRIYFCPSYRLLPSRIKRIVRRAAAGWHEFGLLTTEAALLNALFDAVESRMGARLEEAAVFGSPRAADALRDLLRLKLEWPFRPTAGNGLCNYFFEDRRYRKPPVAYPPGRRSPSPFDAVFGELVSAFRTAGELKSAEQAVGDRIDQLAAALVSGVSAAARR
jgi:hypothetical protein